MRRMPDQMPVWSADNRKHETGSGDFREVDSDLYNLRRDAGRDWCGAGGHTFVRTADAAVHKSAKTRSKCRRCYTVLHHHTSLSRLTSPLHNSEFRQTKRRQNFPGYIHILNPGSSIPHNSKLQEESRSCSDCSWLDLKHHYCLDHLPSPPLKHPFLF